jgi:ubiquitin conjugation factor E4 B
MILDMVSRVKINNELKSSILNHMERIKNTILDTDYNLPDDFIDPFLYTEIKNPVMLPNIDQVFDRSSIMSHLREKSTNPLTNELFTIDDFLQYNDTEKVKHQVNTFLDKKRKYIEENYKS